MENETQPLDCRSPEGRLVTFIETIIALSEEVRERLKGNAPHPAVLEAMKELASNHALTTLRAWGMGATAPDPNQAQSFQPSPLVIIPSLVIPSYDPLDDDWEYEHSECPNCGKEFYNPKTGRCSACHDHYYG